jgi:hypothetical protein
MLWGADAHQDLFTRQCCGEGAPDWAVDFGSFSLPFPLPATGATVLRPIHPFSTATLISELRAHTTHHRATHTTHDTQVFPKDKNGYPPLSECLKVGSVLLLIYHHFIYLFIYSYFIAQYSFGQFYFAEQTMAAFQSLYDNRRGIQDGYTAPPPPLCAFLALRALLLRL